MTEVSKEDRIAARREFFKETRPAFLKDMAAKYPEELAKMGIDAAGVEAMTKGKNPEGYDVHCVVPIAEGGSVKPFNLVLIKQDEHNKVHDEGAKIASVEDRKALRAEFAQGKRAEFLKDLAQKDPEGLKAMGLDDAAIAGMKEGTAPKNFTVHHKVSLREGGTNSFLNMALISIEDHNDLHVLMEQKGKAVQADIYPEIQGTKEEKETLKQYFDAVAKIPGGKDLIANAKADGYAFVCEAVMPEVAACTDFDEKVCRVNPAHPEAVERLAANLKAVRNEKAVQGNEQEFGKMLNMMENVEDRQMKKAIAEGYKFMFGETPAPAHAYTDTEKKVVCISNRISEKEQQEALKKQVARASGELDSKFVYATRNQGR